jgi:hypothetical protein
MTAITSIGATVTACSHENHPNEAPAAPPNAICGNRAVPPATGYMAPSSACTSARSRIATPPITHEMTAAGPAVASAPWAPKSHPEPMIEPPDAQRSPTKPISRRRPARRTGGTSVGGASVAAMRAWSDARRKGHLGRRCDRLFAACRVRWAAGALTRGFTRSRPRRCRSGRRRTEQLGFARSSTRPCADDDAAQPLMPTTIQSGLARCSTRVSRKPTDLLHSWRAVPV